MTSADGSRRPDPDQRNPSAEETGKRPRTVTTAFAVLVFVASVIPIPTAASGPSRDAGGGFVGALPFGVGLTVPFHLVGYAVLAALICRVRGTERRAVVVAVAAATAFGVGVELAQAPIPWRSFAWSDAAVNAAGAILGAGGYAMTTRLYALARFVR